MRTPLFIKWHGVVYGRCSAITKGIERTVRAAQRTEQVKELVKGMTWWVSDADRQLE